MPSTALDKRLLIGRRGGGSSASKPTPVYPGPTIWLGLPDGEFDFLEARSYQGHPCRSKLALIPRVRLGYRFVKICWEDSDDTSSSTEQLLICKVFCRPQRTLLICYRNGGTGSLLNIQDEEQKWTFSYCTKYRWLGGARQMAF